MDLVDKLIQNLNKNSTNYDEGKRQLIQQLKIVKYNIDNIELKQPCLLTSDDLVHIQGNITSLDGSDLRAIEKRNVVKNILNHSTFKSKRLQSPVYFIGDLLVIDVDMLKFFLDRPLEDNSLRELTQILLLIEFNKKKPLRENAHIGSLVFDYTKSFDIACSLEKEIVEKLRNSISFKSLVNYVNQLEELVIFKKGTEDSQWEVMYYLSSIVLRNPNSDNLIEIKNKIISFNSFSLENYSEVVTDSKKRELIQSLAVILNTGTTVRDSQIGISSYSLNIVSYKDRILNLLKNKVNDMDINYVLSTWSLGLKDREGTENRLNEILKTAQKDKLLDFTLGKINYTNIDSLLLEDFKDEQIMLYFVIQCEKEGGISYRLANNTTIALNEFKSLFYLESLLEKQLAKYTLNEMLVVIHEFKKDKIFSSADEKVIEEVIIRCFVSKFSYNVANSDLLFINSSQCVFNVNLINKLGVLDKEKLLELFVLSQDKALQCLSETLIIGKDMYAIKQYSDKLVDLLKYVVTEREIVEAIERIEMSSNTLIKYKDDILKDISIVLNAIESKEINNDIAAFNLETSGFVVCSLDKDNCEKLINKELSEVSKREFSQTLVLLAADDKNIELSHKSGVAIKIHSNIKEIVCYETDIVNKLRDKITEDEFNRYLGYILDLNKLETGKTKNVVSSVKKLLGMTVESSFKHLF